MTSHEPRVALVTGGAQRIGATIVRRLHAAGCRIVLHCNRSLAAAESLARELETARPDSCAVIAADLCDAASARALAERAVARWGRLDLLVNNASAFYATPVGSANEAQWDELFGSNLKGPFFLAQALVPSLTASRGAIVNIVDVYASIPLANHALYCMAKAGLAMMTRALARDLGPAVRVNGIAPGAILWPGEANSELSEANAESLLAQTALQRSGEPRDIADAVVYLGLEAPYVTGQVLAVDGGRSLY